MCECEAACEQHRVRRGGESIEDVTTDWRERALRAEAEVRAKDETISELLGLADDEEDPAFQVGFDYGWRAAMRQSHPPEIIEEAYCEASGASAPVADSTLWEGVIYCAKCSPDGEGAS